MCIHIIYIYYSNMYTMQYCCTLSFRHSVLFRCFIYTTIVPYTVIHIAYNDIIIYMHHEPAAALFDYKQSVIIYTYRYDTSERRETIYYIILLLFIYGRLAVGRPFDREIYHYISTLQYMYNIIICNNIITIL